MMIGTTTTSTSCGSDGGNDTSVGSGGGGSLKKKMHISPLDPIGYFNYRIKKEGPFEFALDLVDLDKKIVITNIFEGGVISKHGGVRQGDQLVAVNGQPLDGNSFPEAIMLLEQTMEEKVSSDHFELKVCRKIKQINSNEEDVTADHRGNSEEEENSYHLQSTEQDYEDDDEEETVEENYYQNNEEEDEEDEDEITSL